MDDTTTIGYFGKLPCLGDFATRRLPPGFVRRWDEWLRGALQTSRRQLGAGWLDAYLGSPFWRFSLAAGVCDAQAWRGVLMPSVDRVGRPFPLTVAQPIAPSHGVFETAAADPGWFAAIENAMLAALNPSLDLDEFDARLAAGPRALPAARSSVDATDGGWSLRWSSADTLPWPGVFDVLARGAGCALSCWSTSGAADEPTDLLLCCGLPPPQRYRELLDGTLHGPEPTRPSHPLLRQEPTS